MHGCKYNCYNAFDGCSGYIWYSEGKFLVVIKLIPLVVNSLLFYYPAMRCISAVFAVMQCLSVRLSVRLSGTFVDHVKTNKHILESFSSSGSDTILVFPYQRECRYSDGNPPNGGVKCKGV